MSEMQVQEAVAATPPPPVETAIADPAPAETPVEQKPADAQPEKPSPSRFERRISKLYRKLGEADARAAALQKEVETLRTPKVPDGAPRMEQFDDIEKYATAKANFEKENALKAMQAQQRSQQQQESQRRLVSAWEEKTTAAEAKYDDFDEVVGEIKPTHPLTVAIMREDNGADVAYYLGKNPKEAMRIAGLDPVSQMLAVGRLAQKLESEPMVKTPSKAPAPIVPVSAKAAVASEEISPEDDMRTFIKKRNRQLGRK